jgi:hypothetical protein
MTTTIVAAAGIFLIAVLYRILVRYVMNPRTFVSQFALDGDIGDAMVHMLMTDTIRRNGHHIPRSDDRFLVGRNFDYPALYHWILSYVPRRTLERFEWMVNPLIEGLHAIVVFAALLWLLPRVAPEHAGTGAVFLAALGFTLTPLFFSWPFQTCVIGPRAFGILFANIYLFSLAMLLSVEMAGNAVLWLVICLATFSIVACASKFSLQACVFITIAMAAIGLDWRPIAMLAGCIVAAGVLSGGYAWWVTGGIVNHSRSYLMMQSWTVNTTFSVRDLLGGIADILVGRLRAGWGRIHLHPSHRILTEFPWLWLAIGVLGVVLLGGGTLRHPSDEILYPLWIWALGTTSVAAIITLDPLRFLGEAYRYFEYASVPMLVFIFAYGGPWAEPVMVLGLLWSAAAHFRILRIHRGVLADAKLQDLAKLRRWFTDQANMTILAIPGRTVYPLLYGTNHRAVWWLANAPRNDPEAWRWWEEWGRDRVGIYPYMPYPVVLRSTLRYNADVLVFEKAVPSLRGETYDWVRRLPLVYSSGAYSVHDLTPLRQECMKQQRIVAADFRLSQKKA